MGPSNLADERQPLLGPRTGSADVGVLPDPETAVSADGHDEAEIVAKKVDYWRFIWYLAFVAFGGVLLAGIIKGFIENGDVEVRLAVVSVIYRFLHDLQFDFKKALKRALGGGLSGAAGTNTLCVG